MELYWSAGRCLALSSVLAQRHYLPDPPLPALTPTPQPPLLLIPFRALHAFFDRKCKANKSLSTPPPPNLLLLGEEIKPGFYEGLAEQTEYRTDTHDDADHRRDPALAALVFLRRENWA